MLYLVEMLFCLAIYVLWVIILVTLFLYSKVKTLGAEDSDEDDSAASWVAKSRKKEHEKTLAEKRVRFFSFNSLELPSTLTPAACSLFLHKV